MSVYYKFKTSINYDTITFNDLFISIKDFKKAVVQQKFLNYTKSDLKVSNAETNEGL